MPIVTQIQQGAGPPDLMIRYVNAYPKMSPETHRRDAEVMTTAVCVFSEQRDIRPSEVAGGSMAEAMRCEDFLQLFGMDPDYHGVSIGIPTPRTVELTAPARTALQRLAVHIASGYRLRRGLGLVDTNAGRPMTDLPYHAEALLDPKRFEVTEAAHDAQGKAAVKYLREAAKRVDRARGPLRRSDPEEALEIWNGLVRGRWSLVDWFDTDGRRFVLAKPNPPRLGDPRGLTEREHQVVAYAALGESGKLISYRLGISENRVSKLRRSSMRKLGVKTHAELVARMRIPLAALSQAATAAE